MLNRCPCPVILMQGKKDLSDGTASTLVLSTSPDAAFATEGLPASATFKGIAGYYNANADTRKERQHV